VRAALVVARWHAKRDAMRDAAAMAVAGRVRASCAFSRALGIRAADRAALAAAKLSSGFLVLTAWIGDSSDWEYG
jgi:hypothetical protein